MFVNAKNIHEHNRKHVARAPADLTMLLNGDGASDEDETLEVCGRTPKRASEVSSSSNLKRLDDDDDDGCSGGGGESTTAADDGGDNDEAAEQTT